MPLLARLTKIRGEAVIQVTWQSWNTVCTARAARRCACPEVLWMDVLRGMRLPRRARGLCAMWS